MRTEQREVSWELQQRFGKNARRVQTIRALWADPERKQEMIDKMRSKLKGIKRSDQTRDAISKALTGIKRSERTKQKVSEARGGVMVKALALIKRFATTSTNEELARMSGLSAIQMVNLKGGLRKKRSRKLDKPTKEEESFLKKKAHYGKPRWLRGRAFTEEQERNFAFVRRLVNARLIPSNTSTFHQFLGLYRKNRRPLPEEDAIKARLEFFYRATVASTKGNMRLLVMYRRLGEKVGSEWFDTSLVQEEEFISLVVESELGYGEGRKLGYREDVKGLYRVDKHRRWRPLDVENGEITIVTSKMLFQRERTRNLVKKN